MNDPILKVENIHKKIGKKEILKNISFELSGGDIMGFIGPNGAGKTTTIKAILGLQSIDKGNVNINGYDIKKDFVNAIRKVGAIVENPDLYMHLSGYKNLELICNMYNIDENKINKVVKIVKLDKRIKDKVSKYSLGMRQRLGIAAAIIHDPSILILDEPTNGLDPEGIKELRDLLIDLANSGMAILISSHNLSELENFCNKILIIKNGKIVSTNDINDLRHNSDTKFYIEVDDIKKAKKLLKINTSEDNKLVIEINKNDIPRIVSSLVENNIKIYEVKEHMDSLEDAFLKKTGGNKID